MVDAQMLLGALAALAVAGVAAGSLYARQYFAGRKQASKDDAEEEPRRDLRRKRGCSTPLPCHAALMLCMRHHKLHDGLVHALHLYRLHCIVSTVQRIMPQLHALFRDGSIFDIHCSRTSSPASHACRIAPTILQGSLVAGPHAVRIPELAARHRDSLGSTWTDPPW